MRHTAFIAFCHLLLAILPLLVGGCDVDGDLPECPWNVRVIYCYDPFGIKVPLKEHLRNMHEFLFDENGVLIGKDIGVKCTAENTDYHLPAGIYTLVAWGNINGNTREPTYEVGSSTLMDLKLQIKDTEGNGSDDLCYAAIPFKVSGEGRKYLKAALTDAYATINFNVNWTDGKVPEGLKNWKMSLRNLPGTYLFCPDMQLQAFDKGTAQFLPFLPEFATDYTIYPYQTDEEIAGVFRTYRISSDCHLLFRLYADGEPVMKEIDLGRLFSESGRIPEQDRVQQYDINITIDDDTVYVMFAVLSGWEEGGAIGGWVN